MSRQGASGGFAEVLDADVVPADETALAIHHHDLAVVAEIHLEAVEHAAAGAEAMHLHAALAQPLDIAVRQRVAADGVIEEEHLDAVGRTFQQQLLEALAEGVVADDEELHQDHLAGGGNRLEHRLEAGLAVDQQAHPVVRQGRRAGHPHQRLEPLVAADLAGRQGLLDQGRQSSSAAARCISRLAWRRASM